MKPLAISCGEPAGIGPEIAVAAWAALGDALPILWIGDPRHLPTGTDVAITEDPSVWVPGKFNVLAQDFGSERTPGKPNPAHAQGVINAIAKSVDLAGNGTVSAVCTAPIHKAALANGANFAFPGHTEYLAHLAGVDRVVMMLACPELRVVPATIHIPLAQVACALTRDLLEATILITRDALVQDFGIADPRIAVAGLNPHAGEDGKIGTEEQEWIKNSIATLRSDGVDVTGPMSADTMFHAAARTTYDAAICMYHDQALIPIKTIDFAGGVNVTLGLPFIRTSPDHGTAFDIAGQDKADPTSMIAACRMAEQMAQARNG